jgi:hypothetical protein
MRSLIAAALVTMAGITPTLAQSIEIPERLCPIGHRHT